MSTAFLQQALIFLGAALLCVPFAKKLGVGSVIGYLLAGVIIGPFGLKFVGAEGQDIMHASEFGVVMMLFLIGLELNPQSLWKMRKAIVGLGLTQVLVTGVLLAGLLWAIFRMDFLAAGIVGFAFAMSSTAIVLQTLKEKGLSGNQSGQASFSVLLMQDIAVIPMLALLPLLAVMPAAAADGSGGATTFTGPVQALVSAGAIGLLFVVGKFVVNPFLRLIARTGMRELFTAAALLLVIGVAYLMHFAGISAALGAFLAGVLLANSEFRHELESDIEPFKGLLLGLFFTAVGSTINFHLIGQEAGQIAGMVVLVVAVKTAVLFGIAKKNKFSSDQTTLFGLLLCQVGEFAFVLLSAANQQNSISKQTLELGMAVTTITMVVSPLLLVLNEKFIIPRFGTKEAAGPVKPADHIDEHHSVIIAGFGHFGSTVGRFLRANGVQATILDNDSDQVDFLRKLGFKVFYGDCTRLDLLKSAGAENAKILVCTLGSEEATLALIHVCRKHFPNLKLFVRARHRYHAYDLIEMGIDQTYRETALSSAFMGSEVLRELGFRSYTATRKAQEFYKYDEAAIRRLAKTVTNKDQYIVSALEEIALQEKLMYEDVRFKSDLAELDAWDGDRLRAAVTKPETPKES